MGDFYSKNDFTNGTYFQLPKALVYDPEFKDLSSDELIVYAVLRDRMNLSFITSSVDEAYEDEYGLYIYYKQKDLAELLGKSERTIRRIIADLKRHGLIMMFQDNIKSPSKIYLANIDAGQNWPTQAKSVLLRRPNLSKDVGQKCPTDREYKYIKTDMNKTVTATRFEKPTLAEVRAYCQEKGFTFSPEDWYYHYESNGWKVGKAPMKDWKASCRYWQRQQGSFARTAKPAESKTDWNAAAERGWQVE